MLIGSFTVSACKRERGAKPLLVPSRKRRVNRPSLLEGNNMAVVKRRWEGKKKKGQWRHSSGGKRRKRHVHILGKGGEESQSNLSQKAVSPPTYTRRGRGKKN